MTRWKILVDVLLILTFLLVAVTGFWPGYFFGHFGKAGFDLLHVDVGEVFVGLVVLHLALNWRWVRAHLFRRKPLRPQ